MDPPAILLMEPAAILVAPVAEAKKELVVVVVKPHNKTEAPLPECFCFV